MAPVIPNGLQQNNSIKVKRAVPPGAQANVGTSSTPSPSLSAAKKPQPATKPPTPNSANDRTITASTVRPVNRVRRETNGQLGRNSRNSAGLRSGELTSDGMPQGGSSRPYGEIDSASFFSSAAKLTSAIVVTDSYVLKRNVGKPPSLVLHLHPHHFRFDAQDGVFSYASPMKMFIQHLKARTIPHDLLDQFILSGVSFYDGCLIVQVHDHRTLAREADAARPTSSSSNAADPSTVHSYSQYLTPSPYGSIPKEDLSSSDSQKPVEESKDVKGDKEKSEDASAAPSVAETKKSKTTAKAKVYTVVLHPTAESMQRDLALQAMMGVGKVDTRSGLETPGVGPPSTPMSLVPPTPTASSMPPPAKRQKRDKAELDATNITAAEGQILLATQAPLVLGPAAKSIEEQIALLEAMSHPKHSEAPPQPKARKRTVAEVAADEAAAAEQEKYLLLADDRYGALGSQATATADTDAQAGSTSFEPRFERFKVIADIQRELSEKKEQEKIKQQENDRRLQQQRLQQQQEALQAQQRQQAEAEKARREAAQAAQREAMAARQAAQEQQRQQQLAAQRAAAAATPVSQANNAGSVPQPQHAHPAQANGMQNGMQNGMVNGGVQQNAVPNGMNAQAQARFPPQIAQAQVSSPVVRQGTPQNHSSPMVNGSIPMQQTSSTMAASPPRPTSVVQNPSMSVPMAHAMSARGSQQSHPSNTPRMPHSTPNMAHGTPVSRHMAATPRMTQASPPPQMMNQGSQMGQMMMNNQAMNQANPQMLAQMAAQQRALAAQQQQQQANMQQNGGMPGQMSHQQMMLMQRQLMIQQQQQQQQAQQQQQHQQQMQHQQQQGGMPNNQQLAQQYAQHIQNMQGQQMRNMTPQMQAQLMARMQQAQQQQQMGGNNMQRQQMMNGNNMQAILQMQQQQAAQRQQQQQQQAQQQAQQMGQQQHMGQQQPQQQPQQQQQQQHMGGQQQQQQQQQQSAVHTQIQNVARGLYQRMVQEATTKYGGRENIPQELVETYKTSSLQQAQNFVRHNMAQRQAQFAQQQQQMMLQQQQAQQAQQQQGQQQMQGMGGMMGHQPM